MSGIATWIRFARGISASDIRDDGMRVLKTWYALSVLTIESPLSSMSLFQCLWFDEQEHQELDGLVNWDLVQTDISLPRPQIYTYQLTISMDTVC